MSTCDLGKFTDCLQFYFEIFLFPIDYKIRGAKVKLSNIYCSRVLDSAHVEVSNFVICQPS